MAGGVNKELPLPNNQAIIPRPWRPPSAPFAAPAAPAAAHSVRDLTANCFLQISLEATRLQIRMRKQAWTGQQLERKKLIKLIELDKRPPPAVQL